MTSSCIFGLVRVKKAQNPNLFVFHPNYFKFGREGNFEMIMAKRKPKLKLENNLSRKLQFADDFKENFTEHSSTKALPWQQWMSHGTDLYLKLKPIST